jgi:C4-dicarboxylate-specific signal transduction histidine kinase
VLQVTPIVFVVDDDVSVRESLELLIRCEGWLPSTFASAQEFLACPRALVPSCLVLDVSLPGLNGLDLQKRVAVERTDMPIIFITGYGDVPMAVQAMKAGAVEFLTKPFNGDVLLTAIWAALERSRVALSLEAEMRPLRDRSDVQLEFRLQMPDGAVKYVHVVAHIRGDHGQLEYIGAVQDVTERRSSEEALSKARSELSHVARVTSLGVLTASIAHEVNQPLSGIVTNASTCLRMLAADPPNVDGARETARRTIRDGNRASEVITRLRALYGKKEPTIESVDLNELTREVIALSLSELQRSRVLLRPELADDLPPVTGDRIQLQQVILNLIRNGSDAMSSVDDRPRQLLIRTERDESDRVSLTVQDSGTGFDPQAVDRLFEGFYTTKNDGMGIGLSVSRSIIESHHGRLWATLNNGPGAAFSFSIPRGPEGPTERRK